MVRTSLAAMVENLTTTEKVITETIVKREVIMDVVRIMVLMVANSVRTVLRSTLDSIIMVATVSSAVVMGTIITMAVSSVRMVIALMETMKAVNVRMVLHASTITVATVSSVRLLQDSIIIMMVANSARSVLVRDSRADIVSRVADTVTTVRVDSVSVQTITIRMLNIA